MCPEDRVARENWRGVETASTIREDDASPVGQALADALGLSPAAVRSLKEDVMKTKTPLVTGASSGIGEATAEPLAMTGLGNILAVQRTAFLES